MYMETHELYAFLYLQIEKLHRILHNFKKAESTLQSPDDKVILDQSWTEIVNSCDVSICLIILLYS